MATRKKAEPEKEKPEGATAGAAPENDDTLQKAAKAIGTALGTMAVKTGIAHPPKKKIPKLVKKTKSRLPRKEKKQAKKKQAKKKPAK